MNLTKTKRWSEFVDWYIAAFKQNAYSQIVALYDGQSFDRFTVTSNYENDWYINFAQLDFEFQEGVYRKFMMQYVLLGSAYAINDEPIYWMHHEGHTDYYKSFESLVKWFFTNDYFEIRKKI